MASLADLIPNPVTKRHWEHVENLKKALDKVTENRYLELIIPATGILLAAIPFRLATARLTTDPAAALSSPTLWFALVILFASVSYGQYLSKRRAGAQSAYDKGVDAFARHITKTPFCQCGGGCEHKELFILRAEQDAGVKLYLHW